MREAEIRHWQKEYLILFYSDWLQGQCDWKQTLRNIRSRVMTPAQRCAVDSVADAYTCVYLKAKTEVMNYFLTTTNPYAQNADKIAIKSFYLNYPVIGRGKKKIRFEQVPMNDLAELSWFSVPDYVTDLVVVDRCCHHNAHLMYGNECLDDVMCGKLMKYRQSACGSLSAIKKYGFVPELPRNIVSSKNVYANPRDLTSASLTWKNAYNTPHSSIAQDAGIIPLQDLFPQTVVDVSLPVDANPTENEQKDVENVDPQKPDDDCVDDNFSLTEEELKALVDMDVYEM